MKMSKFTTFKAHEATEKPWKKKSATRTQNKQNFYRVYVVTFFGLNMKIYNKFYNF